MICCGLEEIDLQSFYKVWCANANNEIKQEALAKLIESVNSETNDKRMMFIGIPTRVGIDSDYNIKYYRWVLKTLKSFGFKPLCRPYRNENSGNTIVVLAGQFP